MISVDISNVWGQLSLPDLLAMEKEIFDAHGALTGPEDQPLWPELPTAEELLRICNAAEKIREDSDVCVVVGTGSVCLGPRAAMELLQGANRNLGKGKGDPMVFFAGSSLSTSQWNELTGLLKEKDFSVVVISKTGTDTESAIAFRGLRWMLERKYGTDEAARRIYAVTDPSQSALLQMAREEGWEVFCIPSDVRDGFCVLTCAGLLPMAAAGIDITALVRGAAEAKAPCDLRSYDNPVWLYAAVRNLMQRSGKAVELLGSWEPGFRTFGHWWQQLSGTAEGTGLFPVPAVFPEDLHCLGAMTRQAPRNFFETMIRFDPPEQKHTIGGQWKDPDGLNCLEGMTLDQVQLQQYQQTIAAHTDSGVGVITMDCGALDERTLGELFCFLGLSCAVSLCVQGDNPFRQPDAPSPEADA